jgi:hypothetical protein
MGAKKAGRYGPPTGAMVPTRSCVEMEDAMRDDFIAIVLVIASLSAPFLIIAGARQSAPFHLTEPVISFDLQDLS